MKDFADKVMVNLNHITDGTIEGKKTHMGNYIYAVLELNLLYMCCWGAHNFKYKGDDSLVFDVHGMLYNGEVEVKYIHGSDTFNIILKDRTIEDVHVGELSDMIDFAIEKNTDDKTYKGRVKAMYPGLSEAIYNVLGIEL